MVQEESKLKEIQKTLGPEDKASPDVYIEAILCDFSGEVPLFHPFLLQTEKWVASVAHLIVASRAGPMETKCRKVLTP